MEKVKLLSQFQHSCPEQHKTVLVKSGGTHKKKKVGPKAEVARSEAQMELLKPVRY